MNTPHIFVRRSLAILIAPAILQFLSATPATAAPATITLDVKNVSAGHAESMNYRSRIGSYDVSNDQLRAIEVSLRGIGIDQPRQVNVQIWWFGQVFGTTTRVLLHKDAVVKEVSNGTPQVWQSESGEVKSRDRNLRGIHYRKQTGTRIAGWLVQADGDGIHSIMASESNLRDLAGSEELKKLEAAADTK